MGYHKATIPAGVFGENSKIFEEVEEFRDALAQRNPLMALMELSDLIGAIEGWLQKYHPNVSLNDLCVMKDATARAFRDGTRTSRAADPKKKKSGILCMGCGGLDNGPYWCNDCKAG
jgi:hypothetical protein